MNAVISESLANKAIRTSTQLVEGTVITVKAVGSDTFSNNEFLCLQTEEFGDAEGLAASCFTKGRQGNFYAEDGTIAEKRTLLYPQGSAVDAYKKVLSEVQSLPEAERIYGTLAERLKPVFVGKKIAISGRHYVDRYGTERVLRDFNFVD